MISIRVATAADWHHIWGMFDAAIRQRDLGIRPFNSTVLFQQTMLHLDSGSHWDFVLWGRRPGRSGTRGTVQWTC